MSRTAALIFGAAVALEWRQSAATQDLPALRKDFDKFVVDFGKDYDAADREVRFAAFVENMKYIEDENKKGKSYKVGLNEFSDMTPDEFSMTHFGLLESKPRWGKLQSLGTHRYSNATLPKSVDWRANKAVTDVKNQAQCGSCWAFSATGALEGAWAIATGKLVSLSEQQLMDCSTKQGNQGCGGGLMDAAFKYEVLGPVCTEDSYPYASKTGICKAASCTAAIPKGGVVGFKDVDPLDENALMEAVSQQPVSVAIEADQMAFQLYKGGVLTKTCGSALDHGVLVVGYGTDKGTDYWLVKNSWGPSWGESGYLKIERGLKGPGECGIKSEPSYPVVSKVPGPQPGPTPPVPPAPPAPPAPASSHYGAPPCQDDEVAAAVEDAGGSVCAPSCSSNRCPEDVPAGSTAKPQCVLEDSSSGSKYCALTCTPDSDSECPTGSKCSSIDVLVAICVFPDQETSNVFKVKLQQVTFNI
eukprot:CAMPEP_0115076750 /NCGR_PEP_ID=MMETSP0227-20121206/16607_1 /TAXON_ID=89957 /ORGANISM="Polarella glacialis, Strain CCMP 1383" /LENGTH=471 /DNA_ID=CAMNT_0002463939 /DNA_START=85 /DNA_END=1500 /DNA_ORIENTATION=+